MTMLSINGCLLLLLASMASLGSAQPKSLNEPLLQPRLGCGLPEILSCSGDILDAVKTCLNTSSAEEVLDCVKNILNSVGQGDCGACICDVFPKICQEKEEMKESLRISDIKEKDQQPMSLNEPLLQPRLGCGLPEILACSGDILDAVKTCLETSSGEDVLDCIKNILNSMGQGDCGACICDVFPQACQEKEGIPEGLRISYIKEKDPEVEIRSDEGVECYRCTYFVQGAFQTCLYAAYPNESMMECIERNLDLWGQGTCKECICNFIPSEFC